MMGEKDTKPGEAGPEDILIQKETIPQKQDDLVTEKQKINNDLNAKNNTAGVQYFINSLNLGGGGKGDIDELLNVLNATKATPQSYDLREPEQCASFVEKYKDGEYLALAIVLCTFDVVSLGDLRNLTSKLIECLPATKMLDKDGNEIEHPRESPYLSLHSMLAVIGGKPPVTKNGRRYTGFGEDAKQIFINIWEQFPYLWDGIISWLLDLNLVYEYRTTFDAYQITTAFVRIVSLDFEDAKKRVFNRLYSDPDHYILLGALAAELLGDACLKDKAMFMLRQWAESDSDWKWKSACLTYLYLEDTNECERLEKPLKKAIKKRLFRLERNDADFIALVLCHSKQIRTMLSQIIHDIFSKLETRSEKLMLAHVYIALVRHCYFFINADLPELPLAACDVKEQQACLTPVLTQVMVEYYLRRQLYDILEVYLKEISHYNILESAIRHLSAYLHNLTLSDLSYRRDILDFLKNCDCSAARRILDVLYRVYDIKNGGLIV